MGIRVFGNVGISIWFKHSERINYFLDRMMLCFLRQKMVHPRTVVFTICWESKDILAPSHWSEANKSRKAIVNVNHFFFCYDEPVENWSLPIYVELDMVLWSNTTNYVGILRFQYAYDKYNFKERKFITNAWHEQFSSHYTSFQIFCWRLLRMDFIPNIGKIFSIFSDCITAGWASLSKPCSCVCFRCF